MNKKLIKFTQQPISRGKFLKISGMSLASTMAGIPFVQGNPSFQPTQSLTIQQVLDTITGAIEGAPMEDTVDTVKIGDPSKKCTGVVSTFLPTAEIIQATADLGANLIVTHEPTFYNHLDQVEWLQGDPVYEYKRDLLEQNGIVVWRFHDYWHKHNPDGILQGLLETIGWEAYWQKTKYDAGICTIPQTNLKDLAEMFKTKLNLKRPFIVGNPELECSKIGIMPGSYGGRPHIKLLGDPEIEVLVVGEISEWETSEYVRDATYAGMKKGLIILGHAPSEGPGMKYVLDWLQPMIPDIPIYYEKTDDAFIPV